MSDAHSDATSVREDARGRWLDILPGLAPVLAEACTRPGKHLPCPVHGGKDGFRLFKDASETGGGICNTCNDGRPMASGFDVLQWINVWDFPRALREVARCLGVYNGHSPAPARKPPRPASHKAEERPGVKERLDALWNQATSDPGRIADYLRHRGLSGAVPDALRYQGSLPYYDDGKECAGSFPAMLARVESVAGQLVAIHRTYLDPAGPGKAPVDQPKKLTEAVHEGATNGAAIRLAEAGQTLALAEGIETALAVMEATGTPAWATVSAGGLERVELPSGVNRIEIWADHDKSGVGQRAAEVLSARCSLQRRDARLLLPPGEGRDWLDVLCQEGPEALRKARDEAEPWEPQLLAHARQELERLEAEEESPPVSWEETLEGALKASDPIAALQEKVIPALVPLEEEVKLDAALRRVAEGYRKYGIRLETLRREVRTALRQANQARKARREAIASHQETLLRRDAILQNLASRGHTEAADGTTRKELFSAPNPYEVTEGLIRYWRGTQLGPVSIPLCNFTAQITGEEMRDDGAEQTLIFTIEGQMADGTKLPRAEVTAVGYPSMGWVTANWGTKPVIYASQGMKDHLRAAIQLLSGDVQRRTVFQHLGWRKIEGTWLYLHAGGAIGPAGALRELAVRPGDGRLCDYRLPDPPEGDDLREAIRASLALLWLAPPMITYSLLSAIWRAPLSEAAFVDFSLFLAGPTGCQKTELTALAQAHYGAGFHGKNLPGNWSTTANTLEKQAFLAKDALFTVDDFAPGGTVSDVQRLHGQADRLLRAQANRAGRGRMRPDGGSRPEYFPRGLILSSGEDIPRGQSLRSRLWILEPSPGQVDLVRLSRVQEEALQGLFAQALAGYLRWLAPRIDSLKEALPPRHRELRTEARSLGVVHDRTPDTMASLAVGWETFLRFVLEVEAITMVEAAGLWKDGWQALGEVARAQPDHQSSEEPTGRFLALLSAALTSGHAHLADARTGERPEDPARWGWRSKSGIGEPILDDWQPLGDRIGWVDGDDLLLEPEAAFAVVQKLARDQGTHLAINSRTLWKRMAEKGLLASREPSQGTNTVRWSVVGERRRVLHFSIGLLSSRNCPIRPICPENPK